MEVLTPCLSGTVDQDEMEEAGKEGSTRKDSKHKAGSFLYLVAERARLPQTLASPTPSNRVILPMWEICS